MKPLTRIFENAPSLYDDVIDWESRLQREEPALRELFAETGARRVLDAACGSGRHAAMFRSWGLEVEGADISGKMIDRCRELWGESQELRWAVRSFEEPLPRPGAFDVVLCLGNSLALASGAAGVRRAVAEMARGLRPGGILLAQVANLWRLPEGPTLWQSCRRSQRDGRERILIKGMHRAGDRGWIDLVELTLGESGVEGRFDTPSFLTIDPDDLLRAAGSDGDEARILGSLHGDPYDRESSPDIVLRLRRKC
ncbi:MAG: class I SAM-dependent methyltransferase [Planctomycetes bacterium]|nr:class I SAM-dependent methyltransferase [Planctomycetota bacterium]